MNKKKSVKRSIIIGIVSILISTMFMTKLVSNVAEFEFTMYQYVITYLIAVISSLFIVTTLMMIITSIEAFFIMIIDKRFSLRNLLLINYSFFGKCILTSSILIYVLDRFSNKIVGIVSILITYVLVGVFIVLNYFNLVNIAVVNKKAAKMITVIAMLIFVGSQALLA